MLALTGQQTAGLVIAGLALGVFLLLVIRFVPDGLGSLFVRWPLRRRSAA